MARMEDDLMEHLAWLRQRAGLSQQELADAAGVSVGAVRMWEQGRRMPILEQAVRLANVLDCLTDDLVGRRNGRRRIPAPPR